MNAEARSLHAVTDTVYTATFPGGRIELAIRGVASLTESDREFIERLIATLRALAVAPTPEPDGE